MRVFLAFWSTIFQKLAQMVDRTRPEVVHFLSRSVRRLLGIERTNWSSKSAQLFGYFLATVVGRDPMYHRM
jgi:hypothetical protein